jgi:hypothetical protein
MLFRLTINTENDVYGRTVESEAAQLARDLRLVAALLETVPTQRSGTVRDYNGNTVGTWELTEGSAE